MLTDDFVADVAALAALTTRSAPSATRSPRPKLKVDQTEATVLALADRSRPALLALVVA